MMQFAATPYDITKPFFYFETKEQFEAGAKRINAEEFEIQFIDADDKPLADLLAYFGSDLNQCNVFDVIEWAEGLDEDEMLAAILLSQTGWNLEDIMDTDACDHVIICFEVGGWNIARELGHWCEEAGYFELDEWLAPYFNYELYGMEMLDHGPYEVATFNGKDYVVEVIN